MGSLSTVRVHVKTNNYHTRAPISMIGIKTPSFSPLHPRTHEISHSYPSQKVTIDGDVGDGSGDSGAGVGGGLGFFLIQGAGVVHIQHLNS